MLKAIHAFLEFCYIARRDSISETDVNELEKVHAQFLEYRQIFVEVGVRSTGFGLPRQHSMAHYPEAIRLFGALNGLCSSITESKHIKAVKEPWRRSNRHLALEQMLLTNQRLDKLAAARVHFTHCGMLPQADLGPSLEYIGMVLTHLC